MIDMLLLLVGLAVPAGTFAVPIWAHGDTQPSVSKGRDRIGRDPEAAQATQEVRDDVDFFSGRGGSG